MCAAQEPAPAGQCREPRTSLPRPPPPAHHLFWFFTGAQPSSWSRKQAPVEDANEASFLCFAYKDSQRQGLLVVTAAAVRHGERGGRGGEDQPASALPNTHAASSGSASGHRWVGSPQCPAFSPTFKLGLEPHIPQECHGEVGGRAA